MLFSNCHIVHVHFSGVPIVFGNRLKGPHGAEVVIHEVESDEKLVQSVLVHIDCLRRVASSKVAGTLERLHSVVVKVNGVTVFVGCVGVTRVLRQDGPVGWPQARVSETDDRNVVRCRWTGFLDLPSLGIENEEFTTSNTNNFDHAVAIDVACIQHPLRAMGHEGPRLPPGLADLPADLGIRVGRSQAKVRSFILAVLTPKGALVEDLGVKTPWRLQPENINPAVLVQIHAVGYAAHPG